MIQPISPVRFAGTLKILRFNVHFYIISIHLALIITIAFISRRLDAMSSAVLACVAGLAIFWTISSLFVSWYVYDYYGITNCAWMQFRLGLTPGRWANIHAGLDETTTHLREIFPGSEYSVVDIYNSSQMTEPSIGRARSMYPTTEPVQHAHAGALPFAEATLGAVFLLLAAHELRSNALRTQLLCESGRVLDADGKVVLVEHLRDWPNFVAFGPGFAHFYSADSWRSCIDSAGLRIENEFSVTPFVRCFVLGRARA